MDPSILVTCFFLLSVFRLSLIYLFLLPVSFTICLFSVRLSLLHCFTYLSVLCCLFLLLPVCFPFACHLCVVSPICLSSAVSFCCLSIFRSFGVLSWYFLVCLSCLLPSLSPPLFTWPFPVPGLIKRHLVHLSVVGSSPDLISISVLLSRFLALPDKTRNFLWRGGEKGGRGERRGEGWGERGDTGLASFLSRKEIYGHCSHGSNPCQSFVSIGDFLWAVPGAAGNNSHDYCLCISIKFQVTLLLTQQSNKAMNHLSWRRRVNHIKIYLYVMPGSK